MAMDSDSRLDRSTIGFPYVDLDGAIEVARAMLEAGGVPLERDQLAAAMNQAPGTGSFSIKTGAARMFGLIESLGGKYQLTPLGFEILDPSRTRGAKARAFLEVPLYKRVYEEFRGRQLPPRPLGLETAFVNYGVAPKQKDKARHVFDRSARTAGYFPNGNPDRLVAPPTFSEEPAVEIPAEVPSPAHIFRDSQVTSHFAASPDPVSVLVSILDMATMSEDEQQAVWTLIRYLKRRDAEPPI